MCCLLFLLASGLTPLAAPQDNPTVEGWISLFNGKNLEGWSPKIAGYELGENFANTFRVENGVLQISYEGYKDFGNRFGHLFYKEPFSHYRLRVEYRFIGEQCPGGPPWAFRNSGVMLHSPPPESMRRDQSFPISVEVQLLGGNGRDERSTGNVCTPGTHIVMGGKLITQHCISSLSKTYHGDQWVTIEIEVHGGGTIKHIIDGETVLEYEQPQLDDSDPDAKRLLDERGGEKLLTGGYISLQSESHPIEFRRVELLPLAE
ncbi:MAG: 3-keto-disaccharide hydrolase [Candidatus Zipacnadales bacterium]